jgi:hypothetical protein
MSGWGECGNGKVWEMWNGKMWKIWKCENEYEVG